MKKSLQSGEAEDAQDQDRTDGKEREHPFLERVAARVLAETYNGFLSGDDAKRLYEIAMRYRRMDREAAKYVETVICTRSNYFTGEPPYVGWKGLGKALEDDYAELDYWRGTAPETIVVVDPEGTHPKTVAEHPLAQVSA